ncbi:flavin reductase family protein [uncultured Corynebacterium sp.]|uniref:flavin reductase family protein n=1 Tax=uncultured Corynebacterium sp. TaxID=159447 RepID=UPI0025D92E3D|nr:flavin reductase family protein [uncultured Corynebacterium sp.]
MSLDVKTSIPPLSDHGDDHTLLRHVFARFPSGVAAVSADVDGEAVVVVASSFQVGISLDPPLVLFAVQHTSTSWPRLRDRPRLGVSVLGEEHDEAVMRLASTSARKERFAGLSTATSPSGARLIAGAAAWLECSVHSEIRAGDHDVILLRVHALASDPDSEPLVWHGGEIRSLKPRTAAR